MSVIPKIPKDEVLRKVPRFEAEDLPDADVGCQEPEINLRGMSRDECIRLIGENAGDDTLFQFLNGYLHDAVFARRFADCLPMLRSKNADYTQGEQKSDRVAAFKRIAKDVNITPKQAWAVLCQKHWGAVMRFVKEGFVESEPIHGRINDIINYMVLLGAIVSEEESNGS